MSVPGSMASMSSRRQVELGGRLSWAGTWDVGPTADSRGDGRGRLFGSLRGERRDGHGLVAREGLAREAQPREPLPVRSAGRAC